MTDMPSNRPPVYQPGDKFLHDGREWTVIHEGDVDGEWRLLIGNDENLDVVSLRYGLIAFVHD